MSLLIAFLACNEFCQFTLLPPVVQLLPADGFLMKLKAYSVMFLVNGRWNVFLWLPAVSGTPLLVVLLYSCLVLIKMEKVDGSCLVMVTVSFYFPWTEGSRAGQVVVAVRVWCTICSSSCNLWPFFIRFYREVHIFSLKGFVRLLGCKKKCRLVFRCHIWLSQSFYVKIILLFFWWTENKIFLLIL